MHTIHTPEKIIKKIQKNGICVIDNLLSKNELDNIYNEADDFLSNSSTWYKLDQQGPETYASISPLLVPRSEYNKLKYTPELFSKNLFESVCKGYMNCDITIDRIIFSRTESSSQPITLWHADQQKEGRLSFKFMLYLTDSDEDTGAFSYIPGSHTMIKNIMKRVSSLAIPNTKLHSFEEISGIFSNYGTEKELEWFENVKKHIKSDFKSDDIYSINANKGSIIFFDTKGIHRGGVVRKNKRELVRIHCFESEKIHVNTLANHIHEKIKRFFKPKVFRWG